VNTAVNISQELQAVQTLVREPPSILSCPIAPLARCLRRLSSIHPTRRFGTWRVVDAVGRLFPSMRLLTLEGPDRLPFDVDVTDGGFGGYAMTGWDQDEIGGVVRMLPEDAVCIDVGGNWGVWARMLSAWSIRGFVYSFEPSPSTFRLLARNCQGHANIECVQMALGSRKGTVGFSNECVGGGLRRIEPDVNSSSATVHCDSLASWIAARNLRRLDFLKVDVEGFEADVIVPSLPALREFRTTLCFEYIAEHDGRSHFMPTSRLFEVLPGAGYRLYRLDSLGHHWSLGDHRGTSSNYLALYLA
jgi:FkbM family methyltransferase